MPPHTKPPTPSRALRAIVATLTALTVLVTVTVSATPAAEAQTVECEVYQFIGARGSGQAPGFGPEISAVRVALDTKIPLDIPLIFRPLDYPADGLLWWIATAGNAYTISRVLGTNELIFMIRDAPDDHCFLLAGYSQGADAVADAMKFLTESQRNRIVAMVLYGDPDYNRNDTPTATRYTGGEPIFKSRPALPADMAGRVRSYCAFADKICDSSYIGLPQGPGHGTYGAWSEIVANWMALKIFDRSGSKISGFYDIAYSTKHRVPGASTTDGVGYSTSICNYNTYDYGIGCVLGTRTDEDPPIWPTTDEIASISGDSVNATFIEHPDLGLTPTLALPSDLQEVELAALGDFDGDSLDDLLVITDDKVAVQRNTAPGFGAAQTWLDEVLPATQVLAGDMNGDGSDDIFVRLNGGDSLRIESTGEAFGEINATGIPPLSDASTARMSDINGDGWQDIIVTELNDDGTATTSTAYASTGDGSLQRSFAYDFTAPPDAQPPLYANIHDTPVAEVVYAVGTLLSIHQLDASGNYQSVATVDSNEITDRNGQTGFAWITHDSGDLTGDGTDDILVTDEPGTTVFVITSDDTYATDLGAGRVNELDSTPYWMLSVAHAQPMPGNLALSELTGFGPATPVVSEITPEASLSLIETEPSQGFGAQSRSLAALLGDTGRIVRSERPDAIAIDGLVSNESRPTHLFATARTGISNPVFLEVSGLLDTDFDGAPDGRDNCRLIVNYQQVDTDGDGLGDWCDDDADSDADQTPDVFDNCPLVPNASQADYNLDGLGDACDPDLLPPLAPDGLILSRTAETLTASWSTPQEVGSPITSYVIQYKPTDADEWKTPGTVAEPSVTILGLSKKARYDFRVAAVNTGGRGPWAEASIDKGKGRPESRGRGKFLS